MSYETVSSSCLLPLCTHVFFPQLMLLLPHTEKIQSFLFNSYSFSLPIWGYLQKFSGFCWLIFFFHILLLGVGKRSIHLLNHYFMMVLCFSLIWLTLGFIFVSGLRFFVCCFYFFTHRKKSVLRSNFILYIYL